MCFADFFSSHPFALPATAAAFQVLPQTHYFWLIILFINMGSYAFSIPQVLVSVDAEYIVTRTLCAN